MNIKKVVMMTNTLKKGIEKLDKERANTSSITEKQRINKEIDSLLLLKEMYIL
jgi:hypothetical protein